MLTELKLKNLKPAAKPYRVVDSDGLCVEVAPSGSKLWRLRFRYRGQEQMMALGKYPAVGLAEARRLKDAARALLAQGKHPGREKRAEKQRQMAASDNSFEKVARRWLEIKGKSLNYNYAKTTTARLERLVFPTIGALPISELTTPEVVKLIERIGLKHGTVETARRVRQLINQVCRYAVQRGLCQHNVAADLRDILPRREMEHYKCIALDELPALLNAMADYEGGAVTKAAVNLLALTFVRTNELIGAKWAEIDWARQEWRIPKERMKKKRGTHVVPLARQAIKILQELKKLTGHKEHIFYSDISKSKHISNGAILTALKRMGYAGRHTGHGYRHLASTILNGRNYNKDWVEVQLAHADDNKIRGTYNHAQYLLERKKMMQDYADILDIARKGSGEVIAGRFNKRG